VNGECVGWGIVDGNELDARFHEPRDEMQVAGQAAEFRDNKGRAMDPAEPNRFSDRRPNVALLALGLDHFLAISFVYRYAVV
jgi:hypothetical protein